MPAAVYARRVVSQVTKKNPPTEFWDGAQSWLLYFVTTWLPTWISVSSQILTLTDRPGDLADLHQHRLFYATFKLAKLRQ